MRELVPLVTSKITPPVMRPCKQQDKQAQLKPTRGETSKTTNIWTGTGRGAYDDKRGDGLVHPLVPFQQVADDNAAAQQRDEDVDGDDGVVVRDREPSGFEEGSPIQPHVDRHLSRSTAPGSLRLQQERQWQQ
jgi:hypothetical protein